MDKVLAVNQPAGSLVYTTRQTKAMTTGADTQTLTVPANHIWIVYWGRIGNNSGAAIDCRVQLQDDQNDFNGDFVIANLADGGDLVFPAWDSSSDPNEFGAGAYPFVIPEGWDIVLSWSADAGKSGNSYWFICIRQIYVG